MKKISGLKNLVITAGIGGVLLTNYTVVSDANYKQLEAKEKSIENGIRGKGSSSNQLDSFFSGGLPGGGSKQSKTMDDWLKTTSGSSNWNAWKFSAKGKLVLQPTFSKSSQYSQALNNFLQGKRTITEWKKTDDGKKQYNKWRVSGDGKTNLSPIWKSNQDYTTAKGNWVNSGPSRKDKDAWLNSSYSDSFYNNWYAGIDAATKQLLITEWKKSNDYQARKLGWISQQNKPLKKTWLASIDAAPYYKAWKTTSSGITLSKHEWEKTSDYTTKKDKWVKAGPKATKSQWLNSDASNNDYQTWKNLPSSRPTLLTNWKKTTDYSTTLINWVKSGPKQTKTQWLNSLNKYWEPYYQNWRLSTQGTNLLQKVYDKTDDYKNKLQSYKANGHQKDSFTTWIGSKDSDPYYTKWANSPAGETVLVDEFKKATSDYQSALNTYLNSKQKRTYLEWQKTDYANGLYLNWIKSAQAKDFGTQYQSSNDYRQKLANYLAKSPSKRSRLQWEQNKLYTSYFQTWKAKPETETWFKNKYRAATNNQYWNVDVPSYLKNQLSTKTPASQWVKTANAQGAYDAWTQTDGGQNTLFTKWITTKDYKDKEAAYKSGIGKSVAKRNKATWLNLPATLPKANSWFNTLSQNAKKTFIPNWKVTNDYTSKRKAWVDSSPSKRDKNYWLTSDDAKNSFSKWKVLATPQSKLLDEWHRSDEYTAGWNKFKSNSPSRQPFANWKRSQSRFNFFASWKNLDHGKKVLANQFQTKTTYQNALNTWYTNNPKDNFNNFDAFKSSHDHLQNYRQWLINTDSATQTALTTKYYGTDAFTKKYNNWKSAKKFHYLAYYDFGKTELQKPQSTYFNDWIATRASAFPAIVSGYKVGARYLNDIEKWSKTQTFTSSQMNNWKTTSDFTSHFNVFKSNNKHNHQLNQWYRNSVTFTNNFISWKNDLKTNHQDQLAQYIKKWKGPAFTSSYQKWVDSLTDSKLKVWDDFKNSEDYLNAKRVYISDSKKPSTKRDKNYWSSTSNSITAFEKYINSQTGFSYFKNQWLKTNDYLLSLEKFKEDKRLSTSYQDYINNHYDPNSWTSWKNLNIDKIRSYWGEVNFNNAFTKWSRNFSSPSKSKWLKNDKLSGPYVTAYINSLTTSQLEKKWKKSNDYLTHLNNSKSPITYHKWLKGDYANNQYNKWYLLPPHWKTISNWWQKTSNKKIITGYESQWIKTRSESGSLSFQDKFSTFATSWKSKNPNYANLDAWITNSDTALRWITKIRNYPNEVNNPLRQELLKYYQKGPLTADATKWVQANHKLNTKERYFNSPQGKATFTKWLQHLLSSKDETISSLFKVWLEKSYGPNSFEEYYNSQTMQSMYEKLWNEVILDDDFATKNPNLYQKLFSFWKDNLGVNNNYESKVNEYFETHSSTKAVTSFEEWKKTYLAQQYKEKYDEIYRHKNLADFTKAYKKYFPETATIEKWSKSHHNLEKYQTWAKSRPQELKDAWYLSKSGPHNYRFIMDQLMQSWKQANPHLDTVEKWAASDSANASWEDWKKKNFKEITAHILDFYKDIEYPGGTAFLQSMANDDVMVKRFWKSEEDYRNDPENDEYFATYLTSIINKKGVYESGFDAYKKSDIYRANVEEYYALSQYHQDLGTQAQFDASLQSKRQLDKSYQEWFNDNDNPEILNLFKKSSQHLAWEDISDEWKKWKVYDLIKKEINEDHFTEKTKLKLLNDIIQSNPNIVDEWKKSFYYQNEAAKYVAGRKGFFNDWLLHAHKEKINNEFLKNLANDQSLYEINGDNYLISWKKNKKGKVSYFNNKKAIKDSLFDFVANIEDGKWLKSKLNSDPGTILKWGEESLWFYYQKFYSKIKYEDVKYNTALINKWRKQNLSDPKLYYFMLWKNLLKNLYRKDVKITKNAVLRIFNHLAGEDYIQKAYNQYYDDNALKDKYSYLYDTSKYVQWIIKTSQELNANPGFKKVLSHQWKGFMTWYLTHHNDEYQNKYLKQLKVKNEQSNASKLTKWKKANQRLLKDTFKKTKNLNQKLYFAFKKDKFDQSAAYKPKYISWVSQKDHRWILLEKEYKLQTSKQISETYLGPFNRDIMWRWNLVPQDRWLLDSTEDANEEKFRKLMINVPKNSKVLKYREDMLRKAIELRLPGFKTFYLKNKDKNLDYTTWYNEAFRTRSKWLYDKLYGIFSGDSDDESETSNWKEMWGLYFWSWKRDWKWKSEVKTLSQNDKWVKYKQDKLHQFLTKIGGKRALIALWKKRSSRQFDQKAIKQIFKWSYDYQDFYNKHNLEWNYYHFLRQYAKKAGYNDDTTKLLTNENQDKFWFKEIEKEWLNQNKNKAISDWKPLDYFYENIAGFEMFLDLEISNFKFYEANPISSRYNPFYWTILKSGDSKFFNKIYETWTKDKHRTLSFYQESNQAYVDYTKSFYESYKKTPEYNTNFDAWASNIESGYLAYAKSATGQKAYQDFFDAKFKLSDPLQDEYDSFQKRFNNRQDKSYTSLTTWFNSEGGQEKFWEFTKDKYKANSANQKLILSHLRNSGFLNKYAPFEQLKSQFKNQDYFVNAKNKIKRLDPQVVLAHYYQNPQYSHNDFSFKRIIDYWAKNHKDATISNFDNWLQNSSFEENSDESKYDSLQKQFTMWKAIALANTSYEQTLKENWYQTQYFKDKAYAWYQALPDKSLHVQPAREYNSIADFAKKTKIKHIREFTRNLATVINQITDQTITHSYVKNEFFKEVDLDTIQDFYEGLIVHNQLSSSQPLIDPATKKPTARFYHLMETRENMRFYIANGAKYYFDQYVINEYKMDKQRQLDPLFTAWKGNDDNLYDFWFQNDGLKANLKQQHYDYQVQKFFASKNVKEFLSLWKLEESPQFITNLVKNNSELRILVSQDLDDITQSQAFVDYVYDDEKMQEIYFDTQLARKDYHHYEAENDFWYQNWKNGFANDKNWKNYLKDNFIKPYGQKIDQQFDKEMYQVFSNYLKKPENWDKVNNWFEDNWQSFALNQLVSDGEISATDKRLFESGKYKVFALQSAKFASLMNYMKLNNYNDDAQARAKTFKEKQENIDLFYQNQGYIKWKIQQLNKKDQFATSLVKNEEAWKLSKIYLEAINSEIKIRFNTIKTFDDWANSDQKQYYLAKWKKLDPINNKDLDGFKKSTYAYQSYHNWKEIDLWFALWNENEFTYEHKFKQWSNFIKDNLDSFVVRNQERFLQQKFFTSKDYQEYIKDKTKFYIKNNLLSEKLLLQGFYDSASLEYKDNFKIYNYINYLKSLPSDNDNNLWNVLDEVLSDHRYSEFYKEDKSFAKHYQYREDVFTQGDSNQKDFKEWLITQKQSLKPQILNLDFVKQYHKDYKDNAPLFANKDSWTKKNAPFKIYDQFVSFLKNSQSVKDKYELSHQLVKDYDQFITKTYLDQLEAIIAKDPSAANTFHEWAKTSNEVITFFKDQKIAQREYDNFLRNQYLTSQDYINDFKAWVATQNLPKAYENKLFSLTKPQKTTSFDQWKASKTLHSRAWINWINSDKGTKIITSLWQGKDYTDTNDGKSFVFTASNDPLDASQKTNFNDFANRKTRWLTQKSQAYTEAQWLDNSYSFLHDFDLWINPLHGASSVGSQKAIALYQKSAKYQEDLQAWIEKGPRKKSFAKWYKESFYRDEFSNWIIKDEIINKYYDVLYSQWILTANYTTSKNLWVTSTGNLQDDYKKGDLTHDIDFLKWYSQFENSKNLYYAEAKGEIVEKYNKWIDPSVRNEADYLLSNEFSKNLKLNNWENREKLKEEYRKIIQSDTNLKNSLYLTHYVVNWHRPRFIKTTGQEEVFGVYNDPKNFITSPEGKALVKEWAKFYDNSARFFLTSKYAKSAYDLWVKNEAQLARQEFRKDDNSLQTLGLKWFETNQNGMSDWKQLDSTKKLYEDYKTNLPSTYYQDLFKKEANYYTLLEDWKQNQLLKTGSDANGKIKKDYNQKALSNRDYNAWKIKILVDKDFYEKTQDYKDDVLAWSMQNDLVKRQNVMVKDRSPLNWELILFKNDLISDYANWKDTAKNDEKKYLLEGNTQFKKNLTKWIYSNYNSLFNHFIKSSSSNLYYNAWVDPNDEAGIDFDTSAAFLQAAKSYVKFSRDEELKKAKAFFATSSIAIDDYDSLLQNDYLSTQDYTAKYNEWLTSDEVKNHFLTTLDAQELFRKWWVHTDGAKSTYSLSDAYKDGFKSYILAQPEATKLRWWQGDQSGHFNTSLTKWIDSQTTLDKYKEILLWTNDISPVLQNMFNDFKDDYFASSQAQSDYQVWFMDQKQTDHYQNQFKATNSYITKLNTWIKDNGKSFYDGISDDTLLNQIYNLWTDPNVLIEKNYYDKANGVIPSDYYTWRDNGKGFTFFKTQNADTQTYYQSWQDPKVQTEANYDVSSQFNSDYDTWLNVDKNKLAFYGTSSQSDTDYNSWVDPLVKNPTPYSDRINNPKTKTDFALWYKTRDNEKNQALYDSGFYQTYYDNWDDPNIIADDSDVNTSKDKWNKTKITNDYESSPIYNTNLATYKQTQTMEQWYLHHSPQSSIDYNGWVDPLVYSEDSFKTSSEYNQALNDWFNKDNWSIYFQTQAAKDAYGVWVDPLKPTETLYLKDEIKKDARSWGLKNNNGKNIYKTKAIATSDHNSWVDPKVFTEDDFKKSKTYDDAYIAWSKVAANGKDSYKDVSQSNTDYTLWVDPERHTKAKFEADEKGALSSGLSTYYQVKSRGINLYNQDGQSVQDYVLWTDPNARTKKQYDANNLGQYDKDLETWLTTNNYANLIKIYTKQTESDLDFETWWINNKRDEAGYLASPVFATDFDKWAKIKAHGSSTYKADSQSNTDYNGWVDPNVRIASNYDSSTQFTTDLNLWSNGIGKDQGWSKFVAMPWGQLKYAQWDDPEEKTKVDFDTPKDKVKGDYVLPYQLAYITWIKSPQGESDALAIFKVQPETIKAFDEWKKKP